jgi:hypothetical protein
MDCRKSSQEDLFMATSRHLTITLSLIPILTILFIIGAFGNPQSQYQSSPSSTPEPTKVTPFATETGQNLQILEARIDSLEKFVELQADSYSAAISRTESNINVILIVMSVAAILVTILGYAIVRGWISRTVEERITIITSEHIQNSVKAEVEKVRQEWDPKFAALYEEYRKSIPRR